MCLTCLSVGLMLRDKNVHNPHTGSYWATSLFFSLVQELTPLWNFEKGELLGTFQRSTPCGTTDRTFSRGSDQAY